MAEAVWASQSEERAAELGGGTRGGPIPGKANVLRCSFCRVELREERLPMSVAGRGHWRAASRFCSTRCLNCVLALEALNPSPLASHDFISRRELLTDRLIDLWRHGQGPDPALVLEAARSAGSGFDTGAGRPTFVRET
jgi:hypothetical protein